jgi:hypothetical protein
MRCIALLLAAALLAACGEDEPAAAPKTDLVVRFDADGPQGGKPAKTTRVQCPGDGCAATKGLTSGDFAPTPANQACTQIYGGPETATVKGAIDGQPVDASFKRTDGCEINRWEKVQALLGVR